MKAINSFIFSLGMISFLGVFSGSYNGCDLFSSTKSRDTLVLEATRGSLVMLPKGSPTLGYLEKKKLLVARKVNATIFLKFNECDKEIDFPLLDNSKEAKEVLSKGLGKRVRVTLVVLWDRNIPYYKNKPFVMVAKLRASDF